MQTARTASRKAVAYVVRDECLLAIKHVAVPLDQAGVQVPAGTVEAGEEPADAAVREVWEETGVRAHVLRSLGVQHYDLSPFRFEVAERHFFLLEPTHPTPDRWRWDELHPEHGVPQPLECWWLPLRNAPVLAAGLGAMIGSLYD